MPQNNSRAMREQRREQAETRQKAYDALSDDQKLVRIESRPGRSERERRRLGVWQ